jgi:hypothetical protein
MKTKSTRITLIALAALAGTDNYAGNHCHDDGNNKTYTVNVHKEHHCNSISGLKYDGEKSLNDSLTGHADNNGTFSFTAALQPTAKHNGYLSVIHNNTELTGNTGKLHALVQNEQNPTQYTVEVYGITQNLQLKVNYLNNPTVYITQGGVTVDKTQGYADLNGNFQLTVTLDQQQIARYNGKFIIEIDNNEDNTIQYNVTQVNDATYNIDFTGINNTTTLNITYETLPLMYVVEAETGTHFTAPRNPIDIGNTDSGTFTFQATLKDNVTPDGTLSCECREIVDGDPANIVNANVKVTPDTNNHNTYNFNVTLPTGNNGVNAMVVFLKYITQNK